MGSTPGKSECGLSLEEEKTSLIEAAKQFQNTIEGAKNQSYITDVSWFPMITGNRLSECQYNKGHIDKEKASAIKLKLRKASANYNYEHANTVGMGSGLSCDDILRMIMAPFKGRGQTKTD